MTHPLIDYLAAEVEKLKQAGTFKEELVLESPQDARVKVLIYLALKA